MHAFLHRVSTIGSPGSQECTQNLITIISCCQNLGVPIKQESEELRGLPDGTGIPIGIVIDMSQMELGLFQEQITSLRSVLCQWEHKKRCYK